jgi:hypothetical protein
MVSDITEELDVPDITLRDWLMLGAPFKKDGRNHIWINGEEFAKGVMYEKKPVSARKLGDDETYCLHSRAIVPLIEPETSEIKKTNPHQRKKCFLWTYDTADRAWAEALGHLIFYKSVDGF